MHGSKRTARTIVALIAAYVLALNAIFAGLGAAVAVGHAAIGLDVICADGSAPGAPIRPVDHSHAQACCTAACGHGVGACAISVANAWLAVRYALLVLVDEPLKPSALYAPAVFPVGSRAPPQFV
jgi:hypothetical protein